ncbi:probable T-complex protein 1 subunit theta [Aspergillus lentulus]|uniref:M48 family metallopeptidase n=1 Tax=Aspergillus lentulus TaxID=293939 RepID=UPI0013925B03|nr:probable T-complex protein 1 subunit theta [Aspergillus lentulus]GFF23618.1 probable T-complex protein 1 subunit theta [Aspergillus lentulus]GFF51321.1 probable T-complex protein 1 subunit theta [Aspergillus lentulus]GFF98566.1 probable T-complex protein 1 subunit theta [Aspergillus lentulus]
MLRSPIARAIFRSATAWSTIPSSSQSASRIAAPVLDSSYFSGQTFRYPRFPSATLGLTSRAFTSPSQTSFRIRNRYFSSSARLSYGYGGGRYRRFDGPSRGTLFQRLLTNARPYHFVIIGVVIGGIYTSNVETVEMTGRRRFNCVSSHQELKMGQQSYEEVLRSTRGKILPENHPLAIMVNRVLRRLIPQAPIEGADWRVHVIKDDGMVNAFVLPGGKVFVYTGILPICKDEDGLAAVLGHEIAHVVAHHPAERMSNNILTVGAVFLISMLFDISGQIPSLLLNLMYSLPNSRTQEAEADNIGLMMMSKACFNPEAAVGLWARMQKAEQEAPPQFLSTHPSSYNRMEAIRGWLGKAEEIYEDSGCSTLGNYMPGFRQASNDYYRW